MLDSVAQFVKQQKLDGMCVWQIVKQSDGVLNMDSGIMQAFLMKVQSVFRQLSHEQVGYFAAEWFFSRNGRAENNPPRWSIVFRSPIFYEKSQNHYHPPLEVFEDFFGADAEKQRSFRGCFPRIHTPQKLL